MTNFTEQERNDIICALEIAAEHYRKDAQIMRENGVPLADTFEDQADRAERLIEKLA
jgi:hypothetical protein